jgi:molybdopterin/thiamine biosynthesis adenylyltransferase
MASPMENAGSRSGAALEQLLRSRARDGTISWADQLEAARRFEVSVKEVEAVVLGCELRPLRYQRNARCISAEQQLRLLQSSVAVVGCGGLGGYLVETLARLGVGKLTVIDPDVFEEHNLNRQLLCSLDVLGAAKVDVARQRVAAINPVVELEPVREAFSASNGEKLLTEHDAVADALDNIPLRRELGDVCSRLGVPLVHGSIGGFYGQVTVQLPGEDSLKKIFGEQGDDSGIETELGNPAFTPGVVACIEAAEVCKLLLGLGTSLSNRLFHIDLLAMQVMQAVL